MVRPLYALVGRVRVESLAVVAAAGALKLTNIALAHLKVKALGCTQAILHASPSGQPVYSRLGFAGSHEMQLDLSNQ